MAETRSYAVLFSDSGAKQCRRIGNYEICLFRGGRRGNGVQDNMSSVRAWIKPLGDSPIRGDMWTSYQLYEGDWDQALLIWRALRTSAEVEKMFDESKRNGGGAFAKDRL